MQSSDEQIEQIRRALWNRTGQLGASVMVGAGFSLNATKVRAHAPPFLVWGQLMSRIETRLGYRDSQGRSTADALRLASEFETAFGTNALEELIKESAPDEMYSPGKLHSLLVSLPWQDIFTTNYDRLLERAAEEVPERKYSIIRQTQDIPAASRPRIVKLHGSFPSHRPFVVTEEHFRTYPREFAPFVNLVRQSVMETVLCLVGFSGDDPNFLQWSGWVRDNLGPSAPPIYLCGVLDLTPQREQLLRSRQVIPIDLGSRFTRADYPESDIRHSRALEWLLMSLLAGQPASESSWPTPPKTPSYDVSAGLPPLLPTSQHRPPQLEKPATLQKIGDALTPEDLQMLLRSWAADRKWYPGWVILPNSNRSALWAEMSQWLANPSCSALIKAIERLEPVESLMAWREVSWRLEKCLSPLLNDQIDSICRTLNKINPYPNQINLNGDVLTPHRHPSVNWQDVSACWIELAFAICRSLREDFDIERYKTWLSHLDKVKDFRPELKDQFLCEKALGHLFRLEPEELTATMLLWKADASRPYWQSKWAAINAELGEFSRATDALNSALLSLQIGRESELPIKALSEKGVLLYLLDNIDLASESWAKVDRFSERKRQLTRLAIEGCDPDEVFSDTSRRLKDQEFGLKKVDQDVHPFDPGHLLPSSSSFHARNPEYWFLVRAFEMGAMFVYAPRLRVYPQGVEYAARQLFFREQEELALSLLLRSGSDKAIDRLLDRITVALLPPEKVSAIWDWLSKSIETCMTFAARSNGEKCGFAKRMVVPLARTISFFLFRLSEAEMERASKVIADYYRYAFKVQEKRDVSYFDVAKLLLRRAFYCMSDGQIERWLPQLLELPILQESSSPMRRMDMPEVFEEWREQFTFAPSAEAEKLLAPQIGRLLGYASLTGEGRKRALFRLAVLDAHGLLGMHKNKFADLLWRDLDEYGLPSETGLKLEILLKLAVPDGVNVRALLKQMILSVEFPTVLVDVDGGKALSSDREAEFVAHLVTMREICVDLLSVPSDGRVRLSAEESVVVLQKFEHWSTRDVSPGVASLLSNARGMAAYTLLRCFAPSLVISKEWRDRVLSLLVSLSPKNESVLMIHFCGLLEGRVSAVELCNIVLDALFGVVGDGSEMAPVEQVLFLWLGYASLGLCQPPPDEFLSRVVYFLMSGRVIALGRSLGVVSNIFLLFGSLLGDAELDVVMRKLEWLVAVTSSPSKLPSESTQRYEETARCKARASAAAVACRAFKLYAQRGSVAPPVLEEWRRLAKEDVLPEVRRAWRS